MIKTKNIVPLVAIYGNISGIPNSNNSCTSNDIYAANIVITPRIAIHGLCLLM